MTTISRTQINRIAKDLKTSRAVFEQAYDDIAEAFGSPKFKVISQLEEIANPTADIDARNVRDYRAALNKANEDGWLVEFVFEKFADLSAGQPPPENDNPTVLQSIADRLAAFQNPRDITASTITTMRQCCVIKSRTKTQNGQTITAEGTGFLIAPHLVLTNYHVISKFLDANDHPDPNKGVPFVEFDVHEGTSELIKPRAYEMSNADGRSWLLSHKPNLPDGGSETAQSLATSLDFAILILDGRPGDARGFVNLAKLPNKLPKVGTKVQLWQFPQNQPMKITDGARVTIPEPLDFDDDQDLPPRIYYLANSMGGSSGGLVLDQSAQPIALHDAGFSENAPADFRKNRGIPLHLIRQQASSFITQENDNQPRQTGWHPVDFQPIIGRQALQQHIFDAAYREARIITVMTQAGDDDKRVPKLGRSYTGVILESCLPSTKHHVISLETSLISPEPLDTAKAIIKAIAPSARNVLSGSSMETTQAADDAVLVDETIAALKAAAPGKTIWLMIDDIDGDPIGTQWGSSDYLIALYRRIAREDTLRLVLAGLPRRLEGLENLREEEAGLILEDTLSEPPSPQELGDWMAAHLTHRLQPDEIAPRLARLISAMALDEVARSKTLTAMPAPNDDDEKKEICPTEAANRLLRRHARAAFLGLGATDE